MKRILIADSSKASLVMTSEVFKDHYPGIQVLVARSSAEAITLAKSAEDIDAIIVDFDLPDSNGAQTALLLKKISKTPILITSFDNQDAVQTIENLLTKYEDCKSWLKKPVNPEVVIAVAQRYCDGKIRVQKRIACQLPTIAQITFDIQTKKTRAKKVESTATKESLSLSFQGIIEDCSLSGVKLKPNKQGSQGSTEWTKLLENIEQISAGNSILLKVPAFFDIEVGAISEFIKTPSLKQPKGTKKALPSKNEMTNFQELAGKIVWTSTDTGEWRFGVEFEEQSLSKRLFEAIVALQSRQHKSNQKQSIMKTSRAS